MKKMGVHEFMSDFKYGLNPLKLKKENLKYYEFERDLVQTIIDNKFVIINKGRQMHISTVLAAYTAWKILRGEKVMYFSPSIKLSYQFVDKVKDMLNNHFIDYLINKKDEIKINNGGGMLVKLAKINSLCAFDLNKYTVIMEEVGYMKCFKELLEEISRKINDSNIIITSTPNGYDDFHKLYNDSILGNNNFINKKITCENNPRCDSE